MCVSLMCVCVSTYAGVCDSKGVKALSPVSSQWHAECSQTLTHAHILYTHYVSRRTDVRGATLHQLSSQPHSVNYKRDN